MSWRVDRAAELRAEAQALITASSLTDKDKVTVTSDANDIDRKGDIGNGVVLVQPGPRLTWPAPSITTSLWTIDIITGPADKLLDAWERLDGLLEVLQPMFDVREATAAPGQQARPDGASLPGYNVTFREDYQE